MQNNLPTVPNFPELEHKWLEYWEKHNIVQKYLHKNDTSEKRFSFIDGPITANNPMGVHHGWGRTYKDMWQRFYNLTGHRERFQNGFDCQGLWVEVEVEKELKLRSKKDIENLVRGDKKASIAKFVELCKERVLKYAGVQTEQSKRLGYFMDWNNSYFTMSDENNYMIWHFLKTCHEKGWIYKGRDSVAWCPRCETAISQHEMLTEDYKEVVHKSIFLELPITGREHEYLLIWTTTPWTIPANIAVAVEPTLDYSLVKGETGDMFWVASAAVSRVFKNDTPTEIRKVKGAELVGLTYSAPFDDLPSVAKVKNENPNTFHTVVATDPLILPISAEEGTGLVHTAVSAGSEDFRLGKLRGLPMIPVIDDRAAYLSDFGFLSGQNAKKHPEIILDYLVEQDKKGNNCVFLIENYKHRYPACWRCKTELVWKVADEWYIAMDKVDPTDEKKRTYRQQMVDVVKTIHWIPDFGLERELDWLKNMHDWLISKKNRYWGLALPIYECKKCGNFEVIGSYQELQQKAIEGWSEFEGHSPHKPYIDEVKIKCKKCNEIVSRLNDVGNVWLDAGIVPFSTLVDPATKKLSYTTDKTYWQEWFPADFITESFPGQFKNWFYALIATSTALTKKAPFKTVLGYSSVLAEDGRPMHKSWGNAIEFNEGADKMGVDVMRWLYVRQDPTKNLLFGYRKAEEVKRLFHIPLWNSLKFLLTYQELDNYNESEKVAYEELAILDQWILARLYETSKLITNNLSAKNSEAAVSAIEHFVTDLSTWYIRLSRERTWNNSDNQKDKNAFYSTLYYVLATLSTMISPMLPFFSEEIYALLKGKNVSVHLEAWPTLEELYDNRKLIADMTLLRSLTETAHAKRKELGIKVRQPLARLTSHIAKGNAFSIDKNTNMYATLLSSEVNVKTVIFENSLESSHMAEFDTKLTPELEEEGRVRELIRTIQQKRKLANCSLTEKVKVTMPKVSDKAVSMVKKAVLAGSVEFTDEAEITVIRE